MARRCQVSGIGPVAGNSISHAHNKTKKRFLPNLQKVRIMVKGVSQRAFICAKCIKKGDFKKATPRKARITT